jgi:PDZ domain-containing protein
MKRLAGILVTLGVLGLLTTFVLWMLPADEFIFTPGSAKPLAERVEVEGSRPPDVGDVYYVDVVVRRTSRLEELFPFTRPEGSTVVPEQQLLPPGTTEAERDRQTAAEMARSEEVASAVALRELGYDVKAVPKGALVVGVFSDAPAFGKLENGDTIVDVDGNPVRTPEDLRREIGKHTPGESVRMTVVRNGKREPVTVGTIANPQEPGRPIVGIQVDQQAEIELPLEVDIDLGRVGGPSAGLPFALEIAHQLGRNVTKGCKIAATGELTLDGSVISVGGLRQKTIGARKTDVDLFLVPAGENAAEAQKYAEDLRVTPVESFQQALQTLATADLKC